MTPEEKAIELLNKFKPHAKLSSKKYSRRCALIAVEEIIDYMTDAMKWDEETNGNILYWEEVKDEINLL